MNVSFTLTSASRLGIDDLLYYVEIALKSSIYSDKVTKQIKHFLLNGIPKCSYSVGKLKFCAQKVIHETSHLHSQKNVFLHLSLKLRCDERFTHAFTACGCVFKEITLVGSNQGNYFENATECSKRTLKTTVATQLYSEVHLTKSGLNYEVAYCDHGLCFSSVYFIIVDKQSYLLTAIELLSYNF